jgi:hypothetical protein
MLNRVTGNKQWQTPMTKTKNTNTDFIYWQSFFSSSWRGLNKNPLQKIQKQEEKEM